MTEKIDRWQHTSCPKMHNTPLAKLHSRDSDPAWAACKTCTRIRTDGNEGLLSEWRACMGDGQKILAPLPEKPLVAEE